MGHIYISMSTLLVLFSSFFLPPLSHTSFYLTRASLHPSTTEEAYLFPDQRVFDSIMAPTVPDSISLLPLSPVL